MAAKRENTKDDDSPGDSKPSFFQSWVDSLKEVLPGSGKAEKSSVLKEFSLKGVARFIKEEKPKNIVVMTGAGISTSAGIPDFRSPGTGLYDNLAQYNLPDPMAIFEIGYFMQNPKPFFTLAKELFPKTLKPTPCHYFIRLLEEKGLLLRTYTQNIDSLEQVAGINNDKVIAAHGSSHTNTCMMCKDVYPMQWMSDKLNSADTDVPRCENCEGVVKPDIVFFGEALPRKFFVHALTVMTRFHYENEFIIMETSKDNQDFPKCDLLIIMGTSLVVQPFASMIGEVGTSVPRLLINMTKAGQVSMHEKISGLRGLHYDHPENYRDAFWQGTCDDGCQKLADLLGWGDELRELVKREWARIDAAAKTGSSI